MKSFSVQDRENEIEFLQENPEELYDLLIVGGGITGAGVARDAASRGLKVVLVEKNDFAFGTSSRSTKLIHGGLRYLENLEFKLVFEALSERQILFDIAPHLVHPLRFLLPIYDDSRVGMFKMGCGMWLYDTLAAFRGGSHERLNCEEVADRAPFLKSEGLQGAFAYSDAYMDDDRLVLETLRSAHDMGAICLNYVSAAVPIVENDKIVGMVCEDRKTTNKWPVKARHVISTVGPWTDIFGKHLFEDWKALLKPSKGIHLTLPKERFPVENAVVLSDDDKGRIVFAIPREEMVIVGTTDTAFNGSPDEVHASAEDVTYLIEMLNSYFPEGKFQKSDFCASYAGIRPLVNSGAEGVGKTSREHTILQDPRGVTFVAGGKYTTYRKMAEEIVDHALRNFDLSRVGEVSPSDTARPINPFCTLEGLQRSELVLEDWAQEIGCSQEEMHTLWRRHGEEAYAIRKSGSSLWSAEAEFAIQNAMTNHLLDFYLRRVPLFLAEHDHGLKFLDEISEVFSRHLKWNTEQLNSEKQSVRSYIENELSWKQ